MKRTTAASPPLNTSILQAVEVQNRIRKVQNQEMSPLVDTYGQINEPKAYPIGIITADGMFVEDYAAHERTQRNQSHVAGALKMNRVFPINIAYQQSNNNSTLVRSSRPNDLLRKPQQVGLNMALHGRRRPSFDMRQTQQTVLR